MCLCCAVLLQVPAPKAGTAAAAGADAPQAFVAAPSAEAGPSDADGIKAEAGATRHVHAVGTTDPAGDFAAMLASGQADAAMQGMQAAVLALVAASVGGSRYGQAVECCRHLRAACVEHGRPSDWNVFVRKLAGSYAGDVQHGGFWAQLVEGGKEQVGGACSAIHKLMVGFVLMPRQIGRLLSHCRIAYVCVWMHLASDTCCMYHMLHTLVCLSCAWTILEAASCVACCTGGPDQHI